MCQNSDSELPEFTRMHFDFALIGQLHMLVLTYFRFSGLTMAPASGEHGRADNGRMDHPARPNTRAERDSHHILDTALPGKSSFANVGASRNSVWLAQRRQGSGCKHSYQLSDAHSYSETLQWSI